MAFGSARVDRDQAALLGVAVGDEQVQVRVGEAGGLQARAHALGGERAVAGRERGVGLDQLLVGGKKARAAVIRGGGVRQWHEARRQRQPRQRGRPCGVRGSQECAMRLQYVTLSRR